MSKAIVIGIIVIVLGAGGYLIFHNKDTNKTATSNTAQSTPNTTTANTAAAATITYSNSGFSPSMTTVKSGDMVEIKNTSSSDLQFNSDPHPVHTDDTDLNVGVVSAGQSMTFTVTKTGTFGFHNHLNPSDKASITIQ